jgi:hypothetical protein
LHLSMGSHDMFKTGGKVILENKLYVLAAAAIIFFLGISLVYKHPSLGVSICLCGILLVAAAILAKVGLSFFHF